MSITPPTSQEISDNIVAQLQVTLNQNIPLLPRSFIRVLAKTLGAVFVLVYKYAGFIALQQFVQYATMQQTTINGVTFSPLTAWGDLIGVSRPVTATRAELQVAIGATEQGVTIPSGTLLFSSVNGFTYRLTESVITGENDTFGTARAIDDSLNGNGRGANGNLTNGSEMSFVQPVNGVNQVATVVDQITTAANAETEEAYRQRIINRFSMRPQGGAYADYRAWGEEVAGIINVYPYTGDPGQVNVYSEATVTSSGNVDGIPTAAQLQDVLDSINMDNDGIARRRNANAFVNSLPIVRPAFNVEVDGISGVSDLGQVRTDIQAALVQYFLEADPFIAGLSIPPRRDRLTRVSISAIVEDIVSAAGGTFNAASFSLESVGTSLTAYTLQEGEKAKLGTLSYVN